MIIKIGPKNLTRTEFQLTNPVLYDRLLQEIADLPVGLRVFLMDDAIHIRVRSSAMITEHFSRHYRTKVVRATIRLIREYRRWFELAELLPQAKALGVNVRSSNVPYELRLCIPEYLRIPTELRKIKKGDVYVFTSTDQGVALLKSLLNTQI